MLVREMQPFEIDSVITLFNYYCEEAKVNDEKYSEDRVLQTVRQYCIKPNLFFRVAYNGQRPVGVIGGFLSEDPVENDLTATIQFNYLIPEFATVSAYEQLIQEFETWATLCKATAVRAIDIGSNLNRLQDVYSELDFNPIRIAIMNKELA
jgi:hypothetical protein